MTPPEGDAPRRRTRVVEVPVRGPWSLTTSRRFWESFEPARLPSAGAGITGAAGGPDRGAAGGAAADAGGDAAGGPGTGGRIATHFRSEADWTAVTAVVTQHGSTARVQVAGTGDLEAATEQVVRFLALDVDARGWPDVADRDPVIAAAQRALPGLRPCGFHSPYEAAAWAVLSQRVRIPQAARLRADITARHGEAGAFPAPDRLRKLDLDLPGRKGEYLRAVADAALDGLLDGRALREVDPSSAVAAVQHVKGLGPFAAELVVLRGANAPDALPRHERHLEVEVCERYGPDADLLQLSQAWKPYRTWAAVHLRAGHEERARDLAG